jgi:low temperature requirement protein LtrA
MLVWELAAAIDLSGVLLAHPLFHRRLRSERVEFAREHLLERFRLFLLIALGETIVTPGAALAVAPIQVTTLASGSLALASTLCLWWLYFRGEPIAQSHVASAEDRVSAIRMGANGLLLMIAGLIMLAAGNALVIDNPSRDASLALVLMLFGGPAMFLVARACYQWLVVGTAPRAQFVTIGLLAATAAAAARTVPALFAALVAAAILAYLVILEHLNVARNCRRLGGGRPTAAN